MHYSCLPSTTTNHIGPQLVWEGGPQRLQCVPICGPALWSPCHHHGKPLGQRQVNA
jgi:hypothetical protein